MLFFLGHLLFYRFSDKKNSFEISSRFKKEPSVIRFFSGSGFTYKDYIVFCDVNDRLVLLHQSFPTALFYIQLKPLFSWSRSRIFGRLLLRLSCQKIVAVKTV